MTPTDKTSMAMLRYFLLYVGIALAIGYVALLGTLAEEFSRHIILVLSISVFAIAVPALLWGLFTLPILARIGKTFPRAMTTEAGRTISNGIVLLPTAFVLLMMVCVGIALWQLSFGQFLLGNENERYPHLIILSGYAGAAFGVYAIWNASVAHRIALWTSLLHGLRVSVETSFLAYAGLWLVKDPFRLIRDNPEARNWELLAAIFVGTALIGIGSFSLMARQAAATPRQPEEGRSFRSQISLWFQEAKRIFQGITRKGSSQASGD